VIEARGISRRYGPLLAVDRVSFAVRPGEVVGLLGPNGAGKTTIMKVLTGYHYPHEGSALVAGHDVVAEALPAREALGYLPENAPVYPDLTVSEYLRFVAGARGVAAARTRGAIDEVVERCGLQSVLHRPVRELSRGFRQRVGIAQALVHDPSVVVLDEPTSGLDPNQIQSVRRIVRDLGATRSVLLSTHLLPEVEAVCDRVLILDRGRLVAEGTPREIGDELEGRRVVVLTLHAPPDGPARTALAPIADLLSERREGDAWVGRLALGRARGGEDLFDWAVACGARIRALEPERLSLEDVFARLTAGST